MHVVASSSDQVALVQFVRDFIFRVVGVLVSVWIRHMRAELLLQIVVV
jgi:hypothetical protein